LLRSYICFANDIASGSFKGEYNITETVGFNITIAEGNNITLTAMSEYHKKTVRHSGQQTQTKIRSREWADFCLCYSFFNIHHSLFISAERIFK